MKNLVRLIKINLLTIFDFYKLRNAKIKEDYKKIIPKLLIYLYAFGAISFSIFSMAKYGVKALSPLNSEYLILVVLMTMSSTYAVISTVFKVNRTIFDAKDYGLLLSLPIKKTTIIASKVIILYITNLIYVALFMIPAYLAFIVTINVSLLFHLYFFISLWFIPLIPTIVGSIVGSFMTAIVSNFKYKTLVNIIISFVLLIGIMTLSFLSTGMSEADVANFSNSVVNYYNNIYPFTIIYANIINGNSLVDLIVFIGISAIMFYVYILGLNSYFDKINSKLNTVKINRKYTITKLSRSSSLIALYKKELKKYITSFIYIVNTAFGAIMLIAALIVLGFVGSEQLDSLLSIPGASKMFMLYAPLVFCVFCSLSCTTNASISLEAKSIWLLKALPININQIFMAKIMVNLTILIPTIIVGAILLSFIVDLTILNFILLIVTPTIFALFISAFGLLMNLSFPDFEWTNEIKVIKQSLAVFITLAVGITLTVIPLLIKTSMQPDAYLLLISTLMFLLMIVIYGILFTKGKQMFKKL